MFGTILSAPKAQEAREERKRRSILVGLANVDIPPVYPAEIVKCPPVVWGTPISS